MVGFTLQKDQVVLLVVDVQDRMLAAVERSNETLHAIIKAVKGCQTLQIPIFVSEQYPQGLGLTVELLQQALGESYQPWIKSTFSCMDHEATAAHILSLPYQQWIVVGIEAHVCVLQTAKGLLQAGKQVTVLNDAISSRSIYDYSTAIAEMRDEGVRISSIETVLFELLKDSKSPEFKEISALVKPRCCGCG